MNLFQFQSIQNHLTNENPGIGDMENMAFMGTMVTRGSGIGVVIATGMKTAMGQIADLLQSAETMKHHCNDDWSS